jgi:type IV secretory pathway component VirB8
MVADKPRPSLEDLMKARRYFDMGYQWYFDRYLGFFWQKKLFLFLLILVGSCLFYLLSSNYETFVERKIPSRVITYINNYDEIAFIRELKSKNTENPNILVANYLVAKYIEIKESYDYSNLEFQKKFLFNNSTSFLYLDYESNISLSNPISPLLLYGKNESLIAEVDKVEIISNERMIPNKAEAIFSLYRSTNGKKIYLDSYDVKMEFFMNDIFSIVENKSSNFTFSVLRYSSVKK